MVSLFRKIGFSGGVHPPHHKRSTEHCAIEVLPPPAKVIIPLSQHLGAPAHILVRKGDEVKIGQVLADAGGFVSAPVHASVSGKVSSIAEFPHVSGRNVTAVEIENDNKDERLAVSGINWREAASQEIVKKIADAGIVGMGGASFPTHVKLSPPANKPINTLIINGAECEPYLTADYRLMIEKADELVQGILIIKRVLDAKKVFIGIEDNKPGAIAKIQESLARGSNDQITVVRLKTKYPQGGEKQLIQAITKRQVPSGGLPMDIGCVVHNIGTAYAIWDAVVNGTPLYQRVVTVTGSAVTKPSNLLVRIGTPFKYVLDYCKTDYTQIRKLIVGGPMMGITQSSLDVPVIKATSGLLTCSEVFPATKSYNCISCGNCVKACPIRLVPSVLAKYVGSNDFEQAQEWNVMDCIECGSCAYVCPSKINLVHFMKLGKFHIAAARAKAAKAQKSTPMVK